MKRKLFIGVLILLLLSVVAYMIWDLYYSDKNQNNPYKYEYNGLSKIDSNIVHYYEADNIALKLNEIKSIYIDSQDKIYLSGENKLHIYNIKKELLKEFDIEETANCITTDSNENIYLGFNNNIKVLNKKGEQIRIWDSNPKSIFTSITILDSMLFVADAGKKVVINFNLNGDFIRFIGKKDSVNRPKGFIIPSPYFDLLIGRDNELWVVNPGKHTFEAYDFDGNLISSWKKASMQIDGFSGCCNPSHIAILSDGSFVTSEKGMVRVKIHLPNGEFKCLVAEEKDFKKGIKGLDLAVDSKDRIYVLDPEKKQIRIFNKK